MASTERADLHFKVILTGDAMVGKTSLLSQYKNGNFKEKYCFTVGIDFEIKNIKLDGKTFKLEIWDSAGDERFKAVTTSYYGNMSGVMIVFDLTRKESFDNVKKWLHEIELFAPAAVHKILVGNKKDLLTKRQVDYATAKDFADQLKIPYIETSAKDNASVDHAFKTLVAEIDHEKSKAQISRTTSRITVNTRHSSSSGIKKRLRKFRFPLLILIAATSIFLVSRHYPSILRIMRRL